MNDFRSVEVLIPGHTYVYAERAGFVATIEERHVYIGPFEPGVLLDGHALLVGGVTVAHSTDDGVWLIDVDGELDEFDIVEVMVAPTNRGYEIGEWEGYCDAAAAHDHASGR